MVFVITLILGIVSFDYLTYLCASIVSRLEVLLKADLVSLFLDIDQLPAWPPSPEGESDICDFYPNLCKMSSTPAATFILAVACWATLQLTWTSILLLGQVLQITRQMTTFEMSNLSKYGFMGGRGASMALQQGHQHAGASVGVSGDEDDPTGGSGHGHGHGHGGHSHSHKRGHKQAGCFGFILRLLGLDRYTSGNAASSLARAKNVPNPFDMGIISNCTDFWTKGKEVGVQYEAIYDVPPEGFKAAKAKRAGMMRDDMDDANSMMSGSTGGKRRMSTASRFVPSFIMNMGRSSSSPYQAIAMSEEV